MKKKLLATLLLFNLLICGCAIEDFSPTTGAKDNRTSITKSADDKKEQQNLTEVNRDKEISPVDSKTSEQTSADPSVEKTDVTYTPSEGTADTPSVDTEDEDKDDSALVKTPGQKSENPPTSENPPAEKEFSGSEIPAEPELQLFTLFGDNPVMIAVLVVLILVILVLIWLIYDRHKMKRKLNNLSYIPPLNPDNSPQTGCSPAQVLTTIETTSLSHLASNNSLTIRVGNLQHVGTRKEQQDSFCLSNIEDKKAINEKGLLAVVADGMGGLEGGALISHLVTDTFLDSYNNQLSFDPVSFLYSTAESSERAVEDYMNQTGINGGSTLVAVIVKNSQLNYISVGDSHIYLLRDRTLTQINKEHSLGALLKEKADKGEIDPSEPYTNPKRNALTAYIGMGSFNVVDKNTQPISLKVGDKILLCSDGVYNALGNDALIVALAGDASTAARRIQADILAQNIPSQDNFTAIVLECVRA